MVVPCVEGLRMMDEAMRPLTLMALSSNHWSMQRLRRNWKRLHRLVYLILMLVLVHVAWQLRVDSGVWYGYALAATLLLLERIATIARWWVALKGPAQSPQSQVWSTVFSTLLKLI